MNKRIKLKKGIFGKKCNESCVKYRIIVNERLITSNVCIGCKHKSIIEKICEENANKRRSDRDKRQRYKGICPKCKTVFYACKSFGIEIGWCDVGYGGCLRCHTKVALKFNEDNKTVDVELWDDYIKNTYEETE